MRRRCGFVKWVNRDRHVYAELHGHRLLERRAAFRLLGVLRERRPRQRDPGALGLGRGRLRFRAADSRHLAFATRDALGRFVQVTDRALAADRAIISVRWLDAEAFGELPRRVLITPAQEVDDVEGADLAKQGRTTVLLGTLQRLFKQDERFE